MEGRTPGAEAAAPEAAQQIDSGNYEVIRQRLLAGGRALRQKTEALNEQRKQVFGGTELAVVANERVRTENNCVPRDILSVGGHLLFGYNVFLGLKSDTAVSDVLALHRFEPVDGGYDCSALELEAAAPWLCGEVFRRDFGTLYRYYRDAKILQLVKRDTRLLAVFQIGASHTDIKVFRWRIEADGSLAYMDDRGEGDYVFPRAHDFEWTQAGREQQIHGRHPHVNIEDVLFVETIGGDLTVKIENNTATGAGIFAEPVDDRNQTLDDAEFYYARLGSLILLKIRPFREDWRYLVYNERTQRVVRLDAIGQACQQLPEDHGVIFPGGYCLQTGEHKVFEGDTGDMVFKRVIKSPNGEDVLYVFHRRRDGHYALLPYNLIRKEVLTPIHCHGYSLFEDGRLVVFRSVSDEPTRIHSMQVWRTPFTSAEYAASAPTDGSFLAKVGNADLVRGISDAFSLCRLVVTDEPGRQTFEDIIAAASRAVDGYYWLGQAEVGDLRSEVENIRRTAELVVDEFEKVQALRQQAAGALGETEAGLDTLARDLSSSERWREVEPFLDALTRLRTTRGHIITLREMRYIDLGRLDELEATVVEHFDRVSRDCVRFLLREEAFAPLQQSLDRTLAKLDGVGKVAEIKPLEQAIERTGEGLGLLGEVIANLQIDDATQRTTILEGISEIFAHVNRVRASIQARHRELMAREGRAEFGAQFKLLGQSVASALAVCDTPERCDEELARVMIQLEELEARFSELDEFLADLAAKREEIYEAFGSRKQTLLDERQRRAQNLVKAAERILEGVGRRARALGSADEVNAYFAADAMIMKLRQLAEQLGALGEAGKADEIDARLKSARQDAVRGLRDRLELYEDGASIIKLGRHRFSVNTQPFELTMMQRGEDMALHLGGTDFHEPIADEAFRATRAMWSQDLVSESDEVYRGEYLAACMLFDAEAGQRGLSIQGLHDDSRGAEADDGLLAHVRAYAQERYDEGYERGVHDADAARILDKLLAMRETAGLLRYAATPRALAVLFWTVRGADSEQGARWHRRALGLQRLRSAFGDGAAHQRLAAELAEAIAAFAEASGVGDILGRGPVAPAEAGLAGRYLLEELMAEAPRFVLSAAAARLREALLQDMELGGVRGAFEDDLRALAATEDDGGIVHRLTLARAWLEAFVRSRPDRAAEDHAVVEAAALLATDGLDAGGGSLGREVSSALTEIEVKGLLGHHARIRDRVMILRLDDFLSRLRDFVDRRVPAYRAYRKLRGELLARERRRLRLDELMPQVMSAFVRNRLINDVYLHLIGDNLAKQMGAAGDSKRTDLMGMLLLISPPGYGKTTLMEYVASRLGLVFVKVNGPSLGHAVHSLDPAEAPNVTARQEVEKINLAFEMGNNVMLYLDDIQHTHPELLQKFISLCDAQRKIEGVWKGQTRTYDLRGKKLCVVMAGNPYTESGESFQIPDMLANRADIYNLGDMLSGKEELFALSYIENALTSNPTLAPLATREQSDVYKLVRMAQGEEIPTTELAHGYAAVERNDVLAVLRHLFRCQTVLLRVNQEYIASAAQEDRYRTEPPFKLQGSYRNMNKLAEKIAPVMTEAEVDRLIDDHYVGEAQTLATEAEQNLLKLAELRGRLGPEQRVRWQAIKAELVRLKRMGGGDDDPVTRVTGTLTGLTEQLDGIKQTLGQTLGQMAASAASPQEAAPSHSWAADIGPHLERLQGALERLGQPHVELEVHTSAPKGIEELLAQQVAIVERTLIPLVKTATTHLHDSHVLEQKLAEMVTLLQQIDQRLRGGHTALPG